MFWSKIKSQCCKKECSGSLLQRMFMRIFEGAPFFIYLSARNTIQWNYRYIPVIHPPKSNHSMVLFWYDGGYFGMTEQLLIICYFNFLLKAIPECISNSKKLFCIPVVKISVISIEVLRSHFWPMFPLYTPFKHQKTKDFVVFPGGIKWEHWPEIG